MNLKTSCLMLAIILVGSIANAFGQDVQSLSDGEKTLPLSQAVKDPGFRERISNLLLDAVEKRKIILHVNRYGETHPDFQTVNRTISYFRELGFEIDRPIAEGRLEKLFDRRQQLREEANVTAKCLLINATKIAAVAEFLAR